jgi:hypothetical protein
MYSKYFLFTRLIINSLNHLVFTPNKYLENISEITQDFQFLVNRLSMGLLIVKN